MTASGASGGGGEDRHANVNLNRATAVERFVLSPRDERLAVPL
jgi:hypothetical protein